LSYLSISLLEGGKVVRGPRTGWILRLKGGVTLCYLTACRGKKCVCVYVCVCVRAYKQRDEIGNRPKMFVNYFLLWGQKHTTTGTDIL
jgi:hypothetical protein